MLEDEGPCAHWVLLEIGITEPLEYENNEDIAACRRLLYAGIACWDIVGCRRLLYVGSLLATVFWQLDSVSPPKHRDSGIGIRMHLEVLSRWS